MAQERKKIGPFLLVLAAIIWGLSFIAQRDGMQHVEGFTFNGIRMLIGSAVLLPFIIIRNKKNPSRLKGEEKKAKRKNDIKGILLVGICLFIGSNLQQFAFNYTEVGKVGFLTALYMLLVPLFGLIFLKKKPPVTVWVGVLLGMVGLYLLCLGNGTAISLGKGEILTICCAVAFAAHILVVDKFASKIDCIVLSCGQFFVTGILSVILMYIFEKPDIRSILDAAVPILYAGIMSSGVAFTLQIIGQKYTSPAIAPMLLCLESVFAVLFAFILPPHEKLMPAEYAGCVIMFAAIIIAQITPPKNVFSSSR